ncbi:hypothetical protein BO82DRAFT_166564 [Aspergillus uvarum CBS 121591]|uniref:Uncharacterized protein n=1 Tax=Aspergillus uvarum CBS 121591 TaxID=1448315 RepID=A0A319CSD0_9EURO|nr:hypothetical protein BO82DRAFT_166564 [Aspergillus uvarum CBS 121591]PYH85747.1 hypothetical protein BO82DRAFT_166564 [Aspergillus uvarum CBS 121591]
MRTEIPRSVKPTNLNLGDFFKVLNVQQGLVLPSLLVVLPLLIAVTGNARGLFWKGTARKMTSGQGNAEKGTGHWKRRTGPAIVESNPDPSASEQSRCYRYDDHDGCSVSLRLLAHHRTLIRSRRPWPR